MRTFLLVLAVAVLAGCNSAPVVEMSQTEMGVRFSMLPPPLGGLGGKVINKGEVAFVMPWNRIYRFDTSVKSIQWGASGQAADPDSERDGFVWTRALDGNEVGLAVKVEYQVSERPEDLLRLVNEVATSDEQVADLVTATARADLRTYMNRLKTSEFFEEAEKYKGQDEVRDAMRERLGKLGIIVTRVNLGEHRFGSEYQDMINLIQTQDEQTNREVLRIKTVKRDKERELNEMQAKVNRMLKEAEAYKEQAKLRADSYFEARKNEADAIRARGEAEVAGLAKQIAALSGAGGRAILKLEVVKQLLKNAPSFAISEDSGAGGLTVRRTDTNQLLDQIGVFEGLGKAKELASGAAVPGKPGGAAGGGEEKAKLGGRP